MKYTIAIAALLGLMGETKGYAIMGHQGRLNFLNQLIQLEESESESSSSESSSDEEDVQIGYDEIPAYMDGSPAAGGYTRVIPEEYTEERDDRLMNSLIKNYAREIKQDGKLTGAFFCNKDDAFAASTEVVSTHFKYTREKAAQWLKKNTFEDTWNHYDVNKDGLVEVERMPMFLRSVTGNALDIDLQ